MGWLTIRVVWFVVVWSFWLFVTLMTFHGVRAFSGFMSLATDYHSAKERAELEVIGRLKPLSKSLCGKLSGHVVELSRQYIDMWADFEGKSWLEPGAINNKTGCNANLVNLPLMVSWPGFRPSTTDPHSFKEWEVFEFSFRPYSGPHLNMQYRIDSYYEKTREAGLAVNVTQHPLGLMYSRLKLFSSEMDSVYWWEEGGAVEWVVACKSLMYLPAKCQAQYIVVELGVFVTLYFPLTQLHDWLSHWQRSKRYLAVHIKTQGVNDED
ncbi:hypothetical protein [Pseudomonas abieticivorans]|uniref:hypothetical protein n=1 Tax=Pseudomonas abieticivorans TaxID=2931382 RepID=UPI0020C0F65C|nr:hypothetical protein [Pseudomonas sp. PIA16]